MKFEQAEIRALVNAVQSLEKKVRSSVEPPRLGSPNLPKRSAEPPEFNIESILAELTDASTADLDRIKEKTQQFALRLNDAAQLMQDRGAELTSLGASLSQAG